MKRKITLTFMVDVDSPYDDYEFMRKDFIGELQCCVNMPHDIEMVVEDINENDDEEEYHVRYNSR